MALSTHPGIDKIAFTGSTATGRAITIAAAQSNLKKVTLELGGKSANISESPSLPPTQYDESYHFRVHTVFESADIEQAVNWAALGVFENAGQSCSAGSRVLVQRSVLPEFEKRMKAAAESIIVRSSLTPQILADPSAQIGSPLDDDTWQGPQVSEVQFNKILEYIRIGKEEDKLRVLTGGERWGTEGYYIHPTVFADVSPSAFSSSLNISDELSLTRSFADSRVAREEIFGPVLVIIPFDTEEEAIAIANDSDYGLAAAVHSQHADQIGRVSNALEAGTVWIK